ncbi:MAG: VWA domain-containing protein [Myxococcota bacterium]|nr:VWA domain-containing protein [Myxococcota bacterium]
MKRGLFRRSLAWIGLAVGTAACAASGKTSSDGPSLLGGGEDGGFGADGTVFIGGDDGAGGSLIGSDGGGAGGDACQHLAVPFLPKIPLVYVLVDRSGSIFAQTSTADGGTMNEWDPLRTATLSVIQSLQAQVAFGFSAYTGINPNTTPGMCPILTPPPSASSIALNNYQPIATAYNALTQPMFKAETPAQKSLEAVGQVLTQAGAQAALGAGQPGGKYILFVTDGETDFCDDGNAVCPADAVIAEIQKLYTQQIQTLILAISSNLSNISVPVLQAFANAGTGLPALAPPSGAQGAPLSPTDVYNQCNSVVGWKQLFTAAGLQPNQALGTYAAPGGALVNATVFSPGGANVSDLTSKLAAALKTVKSCSFDLQGQIKVDIARASSGRVAVDGAGVPYDAANGWTMSSATQLDLVGQSCRQWRATGMNITFDFPCDVITTLR